MAEREGEERAGARIARATTAIGLMHLSGRILGFAEKILMSRYFGTGLRADAYNTAYKIPSTVFFGCEKILNPSLIPCFVDLREKEGEDRALKLAGTTLALQAIVLAGLVVLGRALAHSLAGTVAHGFAEVPGKVDLTADLMRWLFPAVLFLGLSSTTYCILNCFKRFAVPALGDVLWKVGTVGGLIFLYGRLDVYALVIGFLAGAWLKLGVHLLALGPLVRGLRPTLSLRHPAMKRMLLLMVPMAFGFAYSEARKLLDIYFASGLQEGAVSALNYAQMVTDIPYLVVSYALGIAIFPFLSERAAAGRWDDLREILMRSLRTLFFVFVPVAVSLFVLAEPAVRAVYQRGQFDESSVAISVPVLEFYALGMLALALEFPLLQAFYSLRNTLVPTIVGLISTSLHVTLCWWFVNHLPSDDPRGIALAQTIARSTKVCLAWITLSWALKGGLPLRGHGGFVLKVLVGTGATAAVVRAAYVAFERVHPLRGAKDGALAFLLCGAIGTVLYMGLAYVLRIEEVRIVTDKIGGRLRRMRKRS